MRHLFATKEMLSGNGNTLHITGGEYHHIAHVLRMKKGDEVSVSFTEEDAAERAEYRFGIETITEDEITCTLRFVKRDTAELPARIILLQGLPKGDKMEQIIEKNTELGVSEVVPVSLKRCVVKLDEKKAASRVERWNKIANAAAKQARRGIVPKVTDIKSLQEALSYVQEADVKLLPYELAQEAAEKEAEETGGRSAGSGMALTKRLIEHVKAGDTVAVLIGPEGGFAEDEVFAAKESGFSVITLGGRILRTETAGMTVTAWLSYHLSE